MNLSTNSLKTITTQFVKTAGKKSILQTNAFKIHGINPSLTYEKTGKSFELPRFSSVEMRQARAMNKIAINQIKIPVNRTYSKASPEDFKRLTSTTVEDSYSRVEWTNPKDGKIYNLLKQGETNDGKIVVRILDADGAFIKEAKLSPANIVILDNFQYKSPFFDRSHGDLVFTYAKRNNPFANYIKIQKDLNAIFESPKDIKAIQNVILDKGKIDYISYSYSTNVSGIEQHKIKLAKSFSKLLRARLEDIPNTRIICPAGNATPQENAKDIANHILIAQQKIEGVGSLSNRNGNISDFSSSRSSELTQHYEIGEFIPKLTPHGLNITGLRGTDLEINSKILSQKLNNPLIGKSEERVNKLIKKIKLEIDALKKEQLSLFQKKKSIAEILNEKNKIDKKIMIYENRIKKILDYKNQLYNVDGNLEAYSGKIMGTSISTPTRTAKLALNDMMEGLL